MAGLQGFRPSCSASEDFELRILGCGWLSKLPPLVLLIDMGVSEIRGYPIRVLIITSIWGLMLGFPDSRKKKGCQSSELTNCCAVEEGAIYPKP